MGVTLLATTGSEALCAIAAQTCYSTKPPTEIKPSLKVLKGVVASGHHSVIEHMAFTFAIEGISRACSHQLVRHRLASFSQSSQRYINFNNFYYVKPKSFEGHIAKLYEDLLVQITRFCNIAAEAGVPDEDVRYALPNATTTNLVVTMNARELLHFFTLRCCNRAQWEIRDLAYQMLELCKQHAPTIFENAGPPCVRGPCPEGDRSCKK